MRYRHLLVIAAAGALLYGFLLIRVDFVIRIFPTYGDADIQAATHLAIACLLAWLVLEVVHFLRIGAGGKCECGYSLRGVRCPECGRDLGRGAP
jgi:hypothetical protein